MKEILAATDGSESAARAVGYAAFLSKKFDARLVLLNIAQTVPDGVFQRLLPEQEIWLREAQAAHAAEVLRAARDIAMAEGASNVMLETRTGDVVQAIISFARERDIGLVVVGRRGIGRLQGLLIGSVSQELVSLLPCPVVVVP